MNNSFHPEYVLVIADSILVDMHLIDTNHWSAESLEKSEFINGLDSPFRIIGMSEKEQSEASQIFLNSIWACGITFHSIPEIPPYNILYGNKDMLKSGMGYIKKFNYFFRIGAVKYANKYKEIGSKLTINGISDDEYLSKIPEKEVLLGERILETANNVLVILVGPSSVDLHKYTDFVDVLHEATPYTVLSICKIGSSSEMNRGFVNSINPADSNVSGAAFVASQPILNDDIGFKNEELEEHENSLEEPIMQTSTMIDRKVIKKNKIVNPFIIASIAVILLTPLVFLHFQGNDGKGVNNIAESESVVESIKTENAENQMTDEDIIKYITDGVNIDNTGYDISFKSNEPEISEDGTTSIIYDIIPTSEYINQNNLSITKDKNGYITRFFFNYTISDKMSVEDDNYFMNRNIRIITLILSILEKSSAAEAASTFIDISKNADKTGSEPYVGKGYYLFYYEVQNPYQGIGRTYLFDIYMDN